MGWKVPQDLIIVLHLALKSHSLKCSRKVDMSRYESVTWRSLTSALNGWISVSNCWSCNCVEIVHELRDLWNFIPPRALDSLIISFIYIIYHNQTCWKTPLEPFKAQDLTLSWKCAINPKDSEGKRKSFHPCGCANNWLCTRRCK